MSGFVLSRMLYMPGDLQIFSNLTTVYISCLRIGSCGCLLSLMTFSTAESPVTDKCIVPCSVQSIYSFLRIVDVIVTQFPFLSRMVLTFPFLSTVISLVTLLCFFPVVFH